MSRYFQVRWHGRAQQGVLSANQLLARAIALEGKHVQAFPDFGPERGGAPMKAYTRIGSEPIILHEKVYYPDVVIVIDNTLFKDPATLEGLRDDGTLILNTSYTPGDLRKYLDLGKRRVCTLDALKIGREVFGRPFFNTSMAGALIKSVKVASLDNLLKAAEETFTERSLEANLCAIRRGHGEVKVYEP